MMKLKIKQLTENQLNLVDIALTHFRVNDKLACDVLTSSQKVIFYNLICGYKYRIQIIASTQYGKSLVVALACLYLSCIEGVLVSVVAPSTEKAKIIMRYYIDHLSDHSRLYSKLERDTKLDRLKKEESKERIVLNNGGGIFVVSAQERNSLKSIESAMGLGSSYVIGDEYCLVNDNTEATIFRMIAGKGPEATYVKIGNPFYSTEPYSHFKKSWESGKYERVFVNDEVGLAEGRYTKDFLEEAKTKPLYSILFKSEFPDEEEIDRDGFRMLVSSKQLNFGNRELFDKQEGDVRLGIDVGGGGDDSKFVIRKGKFAFVASTLKTTDTMLVVDEAIRLAELYGVKKDKLKIDDTGIGRGASDMLKQKGYYNCGVSFGSSALRKDLFANKRAEMYWGIKEWIESGGILDEKCSDWIELTWTKYKIQTGEKKIILEDKERVKQKFRKSPDTADALALTFVKEKFIGVFSSK